MSRRDELRLEDIRGAIATIRGYVRDADFDRKTSDAVLYNLVVIGEAANALSDDVTSREEEIPWPKIVGLRNLIAHEYFRIDREIIEAIVHDQLDALDAAAERLIPDVGEGT